MKWKPIQRDGYDAALADVQAGRFEPRIRNVIFDLTAYNADIDGTNAKLMEVLNAD